VLPAFIGSLSVAFYTQAKAMGLDKKMKMFSSSASLESIDPGDIQARPKASISSRISPHAGATKNDEHHKQFNRLNRHRTTCTRRKSAVRASWTRATVGKPGRHIRDQGRGRDFGLQDPQGRGGAIQALEGMQMKNSLAHPQGDKIIRKEDHAGIIDCYISRVENGKYEVKRRIPKRNRQERHALRHNLSTMPVDYDSDQCSACHAHRRNRTAEEVRLPSKKR